MYKIQNIGAGRVPLQLPGGCITLESGAYLDLDEHAPRSWIRTNFDLQRLLVSKTFRLVHDSVNDRVPEQPVKPVIRNSVERLPTTTPPPPQPQATVIDLSAEADPTEEEFTPKKGSPMGLTMEEILGVEADSELDPVEQAIMEDLDDD